MILGDFFYLDICSLAILITLIVYSYIKKLWTGMNQVLHFISLVDVLLTVIFHMIYIIIIKLAPINNVSLVFANIFCYLFMILQSLIYPMSFVYILFTIGIWYKIQGDRKFFLAFMGFTLVPIILILLNIKTNYMFIITESLNFYTTHTINFIYVFISISLIMGFSILILFRRFVSKSFLVMGIVFYIINIFIVLVQPYFQSISLMELIVVLTCFIMALTIERSELMNSDLFMAKSSYSFYHEASRIMSLKRACNYVFIKIVNQKNIIRYLGKQNYQAFLNSISVEIYRLIKKNKYKCEIFYLEESSYVVESENLSINELKNIFDDLAVYLKNEIIMGDFSIYVDARICIANVPEDIYNLEYLKYFALNFHTWIPNIQDVIILSDITSDSQYILKNEIDFIINRALKDNNFEIYYQPIYSVDKKKIVSAEALIRLNDPDYGAVPPGVFIPFAENSNLIYKISDFVFESVSQFISSDDFKNSNLECVEINLATAQCIDPQLSEKISFWIETYNIHPKNIRLEFTENAVDINPESVEKNISELSSMGISFALDNYGTGYSDIKKLINLPLDIIKLDRTFVKEYDNPQIKIVVDSTIHMLNGLKKKILIEGIENESYAKIFEDLGCSLLQGYYYSKPLPKKDFLKLFNPY
ncbi:MAG: EAL domain-containing protein [Treponema sp.]|nr:EAL domain-containing protein [Treponema sp.]